MEFIINLKDKKMSRASIVKEMLQDGSILTRDLLRAYHTDKELIVFDISVFNAGTICNIICTNSYDRYKNIGKDGYSFILCEYDKDVIKDELTRRLSYGYILEDFENDNGLSNYFYKRLLKIERDYNEYREV